MKKRIAIMGCGWLGFPLAEALIKEGCQVNGSTTSEEKLTELKAAGIHPFLIWLSEDALHGDIAGFLSKTDALIINVPPKLRGEHSENYVAKMKLLHDAVKTSQVEHLIFVSSTSVYGDIDGEVTEKTTPRPVTESGKQLLISENIFRDDEELEATILRFGGLIGPTRHPVTMLSGRKNLSNGNAPVNLIHLDDCIRIIQEILTEEWWGETFNGVHPDHPTKRQYYTSEAIRKGLQPPEYVTNSPKNGKIVHSYVLTNVKRFRFATSL